MNPEDWDTQTFIRANYIVSLAWCCQFFLQAAMNYTFNILYASLTIGVIAAKTVISLILLQCAFVFSAKYPEYLKGRDGILKREGSTNTEQLIMSTSPEGQIEAA